MDVKRRKGSEPCHETVSCRIGSQQPVNVSLNGREVPVAACELHCNNLQHCLVCHIGGTAPGEMIKTNTVRTGSRFLQQLISICGKQAGGSFTQCSEGRVLAQRQGDQAQGGRLVPGGGCGCDSVQKSYRGNRSMGQCCLGLRPEELISQVIITIGSGTDIGRLTVQDGRIGFSPIHGPIRCLQAGGGKSPELF